MFGRPKKTLLHCPACNHKQEETLYAQSTFCRSCGTYYKIADGFALPAAPAPEFPFPTRQDLALRESRAPGASRSEAETERKQSPRATQLELFSGLSRRSGNSSSSNSAARVPLVATSSGDHPALARMARLLPDEPRKGCRHVHCLECDFPQSIPIAALSTMCLRCTAPIPLESYQIREMHHRRIRTRGDVYVHRKGGIIGVTVQCNNLTIEGEFTGSGIDCDGDLVLMRNGTINGPVRCRRLIVQGRAELLFTHPVHAQEVMIDGTVKGEFIGERKIHLEKNSLLEGDIQTRSLSISEGACHAGKVKMLRPTERYAKFGKLSDIAGMELPGRVAGRPPQGVTAAPLPIGVLPVETLPAGPSNVDAPPQEALPVATLPAQTPPEFP